MKLEVPFGPKTADELFALPVWGFSSVQMQANDKGVIEYRGHTVTVQPFGRVTFPVAGPELRAFMIHEDLILAAVDADGEQWRPVLTRDGAWMRSRA